MKKRLSVYVMLLFYLLAGINHFRNPDAYLTLIPAYLVNGGIINVLAGIAEISFAILLIFKSTRKIACYGIMGMLIAFIPSHIYMLQTGFCREISRQIYCAPQWLLMTRLLLVQPLLLLWAYYNSRSRIHQ